MEPIPNLGGLSLRKLPVRRHPPVTRLASVAPGKVCRGNSGSCGLDVLRMVVRQGMHAVIVGIAIGLAGALAISRLLRDLVFGISATDPLTYVVVTLLLGLVALVACYLPARRVTKVDPLTALRYE